jgi:hypothetical protein
LTIRLTATQLDHRNRARQFAAEYIAPHAQRIDEAQTTPASVLASVRANGYLGAALPAGWGGGGMDPVSYGLVTEEIGKTCSSVRSLMTVHNMSAQTLAKLGTSDQRERWLPELSTGEKLIAFALTEPNVGSAADAIETEAVPCNGGYRLKGTKRWITYGLAADLFLVFAQCDCKPTAFVVERCADGLTVTPIENVFGTRGSMLAELRFDNVEVPTSHTRLRHVRRAPVAGRPEVEGLPTDSAPAHGYAGGSHHCSRAVLPQRVPPRGRRPACRNGDLDGEVLRIGRSYQRRDYRRPPPWSQRLQFGLSSQSLLARRYSDGHHRRDR